MSIKSHGSNQFVNIPGVIENFWGYGNTIEIAEIHMSHFEWIFCASIGKYERSWHMEMLNGLGEYPGNRNILGYCVFDLAKLMFGLKTALQRNANLLDRFCSFEHKEVKYSKEIYHHKPETDIYSDANAPARRLEDVLFRKRKLFQTERELRIVAITIPHKAANNSSDPVYFTSQEIRNSIVEQGTIQ